MESLLSFSIIFFLSHVFYTDMTGGQVWGRGANRMIPLAKSGMGIVVFFYLFEQSSGEEDNSERRERLL